MGCAAHLQIQTYQQETYLDMIVSFNPIPQEFMKTQSYVFRFSDLDDQPIYIELTQQHLQDSRYFLRKLLTPVQKNILDMLLMQINPSLFIQKISVLFKASLDDFIKVNKILKFLYTHIQLLSALVVNSRVHSIILKCVPQIQPMPIEYIWNVIDVGQVYIQIFQSGLDYHNERFYLTLSQFPYISVVLINIKFQDQLFKIFCIHVQNTSETVFCSLDLDRYFSHIGKFQQKVHFFNFSILELNTIGIQIQGKIPKELYDMAKSNYLNRGLIINGEQAKSSIYFMSYSQPNILLMEDNEIGDVIEQLCSKAAQMYMQSYFIQRVSIIQFSADNIIVVLYFNLSDKTFILEYYNSVTDYHNKVQQPLPQNLHETQTLIQEMYSQNYANKEPPDQGFVTLEELVPDNDGKFDDVLNYKLNTKKHSNNQKLIQYIQSLYVGINKFKSKILTYQELETLNELLMSEYLEFYSVQLQFYQDTVIAVQSSRKTFYAQRQNIMEAIRIINENFVSLQELFQTNAISRYLRQIIILYFTQYENLFKYILATLMASQNVYYTTYDCFWLIYSLSLKRNIQLLYYQILVNLIQRELKIPASMTKVNGVTYIQIQTKTSNIEINEIYINIEQFDILIYKNDRFLSILNIEKYVDFMIKIYQYQQMLYGNLYSMNKNNVYRSDQYDIYENVEFLKLYYIDFNISFQKNVNWQLNNLINHLVRSQYEVCYFYQDFNIGQISILLYDQSNIHLQQQKLTSAQLKTAKIQKNQYLVAYQNYYILTKMRVTNLNFDMLQQFNDSERGKIGLPTIQKLLSSSQRSTICSVNSSLVASTCPIQHDIDSIAGVTVNDPYKQLSLSQLTNMKQQQENKKAYKSVAAIVLEQRLKLLEFHHNSNPSDTHQKLNPLALTPINLQQLPQLRDENISVKSQ